MQSTLKVVGELSDSQVVQVVKELFNTVYTHVPYSQVRNNSEGVVEVGRLTALDHEAMKQELSTSDSARFGRLVLEQYARDPDLAPFVQQAWDKVSGSDNLIIDVILTLGLLVNLTLLVATTKVKLQKGRDGKTTWVFEKQKAEPELVNAVIKPVSELVKPTG